MIEEVWEVEGKDLVEGAVVELRGVDGQGSVGAVVEVGAGAVDGEREDVGWYRSFFFFFLSFL